MHYPATPTHYILNGGLGDVIAASPVVKYAIENFHKDGKYLVSTVPAYRDILWFVPDNRFNSIFERYEFKEEYRHVRIFPHGVPDVPKSNLSKVASYNLINKVLRDEDYNYPLYPKNIDVNKYNVDFSRSVIISVGFRSPVRKWNKELLRKLTEHIVERDHIPVLIGTSKEPFDPNSPLVAYKQGDEAKVLDVRDITTCVNLIDKTNLNDLIGIFQQSKCLVGYDGGPIHLAGLTNIPIICAYTYVNPDYRMFVRNGKLGWNMYPVTVGKEKCRFCYTDWHLFNYRFDDCWTGTLECGEYKLEQFTEHLDKIL